MKTRWKALGLGVLTILVVIFALRLMPTREEQEFSALFGVNPHAAGAKEQVLPQLWAFHVATIQAEKNGPIAGIENGVYWEHPVYHKFTRGWYLVQRFGFDPDEAWDYSPEGIAYRKVDAMMEKIFTDLRQVLVKGNLILDASEEFTKIAAELPIP